MVNKAAQGQVLSEYIGLPCQTVHRLINIHHPGLVNSAKVMDHIALAHAFGS
jgi:hypothetical protein